MGLMDAIASSSTATDESLASSWNSIGRINYEVTYKDKKNI